MSAVSEKVQQKKKKKKSKKKKQTALLSFGGDDEEEEVAFQLKKNKKSSMGVTFEKGKRKKKKKRGVSSKKGDGNAHPSFGNKAYLQSGAGRYSKEALAALKGNTKSFKMTAKPSPPSSEEAAASKQNTKAMDLEDDDDDQGDAPGMPSKEEILAARRRREMIRTMGGSEEGAGAPSYIPLKSGSVEKLKEGEVELKKMYGNEQDDEHGGLVTETNDDREEDVFEDQKGSRLFFGDPGKREKNRQKGDYASGSGAGADEEDEEFERYINERIRKGAAHLDHETRVRFQMLTEGRGRDRAKYKPSEKKMDFDVAAELKRLNTCLDTIQENAAKGSRDLNQLNREIESTSKDLEGFKSKLEGMNKQYLFYQTIRDKISDCLDCLNVKAPLIEEAMEEMKELQLSKAKAARQLTDLHTKDLEQEAFGSSNSGNQPAKKTVDEFGRDVSIESEQGKSARSKARQSRRAELEANHSALSIPRIEGDATDDESELGSRFAERKAKLLQDVKQIFSNAHDDFKTLHAVKSTLEQLKKDYPSAYNDTYISLSVPSLFAPYVRVELLSWDFLSSPRFDTLGWYRSLGEYGLFGDIKDDDPDLDVVPKLVEKVVTPFLTSYFFSEWDPLSTRGFEAAFTLVKEVLDHVDGKLEAPQKLLSTILDRFHHLVNSHSSGKLVPASDNKDKSSVQWRFCETRWWRALKILKMLARWQGIVSSNVIQQLSVSHIDDNLKPYLIREMKTKPPRVDVVIEFVGAINSAVPDGWGETKGAVQKMLYKEIKSFYKACKDSGTAAGKLAKLKALVK
mmetsp:Transcript_8144/g.15109  ORF Transcript_8144/g.15109 Transcript_8144/m.15109 type:complete len:796 (-) Transcript_8144:193-2580(-)